MTTVVANLRDPEFEPPVILPFEAGASPFRQKGNGYLGDRRYLDDVLPLGFQGVVRAIHDPAVRAFFEQRFAASDWYDAYPGAVIEATAARLRGLPFEQHRRQTGAWHARDAARGVYGALLRLVSSESVARWGPRISAIYFEFGKTDSRVVGPCAVDVWRRGMPKELAQWLIYASAGFCQEALRLNGAMRAVVTVHDVEDDGAAHGRALVAVRLRIAWD